MLNYAFINLDDTGENYENEFPIKIGLDKNDKSFDIKKLLFLDNNENTEIEFRIVADFNEKVMQKFLAWSRFVVFDGDIEKLYEIVLENMENYKKNPDADKKGNILEGDMGNYVTPIDFDNESKAWIKIKSLIVEALDKYPTTLEEDQ